MRRRDILAGAGFLTAAATVNFPAPAIAQSRRKLRMVTDWPEALPGLQISAVRLAQTIGAALSGAVRDEEVEAAAGVRACA